MKLNERVEEELEKQFPKGDKARGRALVLHSIAQIELGKVHNRTIDEVLNVVVDLITEQGLEISSMGLRERIAELKEE